MPIYLRLPFLLVASLTTSASSAAKAGAARQQQQHAPDVQPLMEWFEQRATVFNRKQQVRRENVDDPKSLIGVFAAEDISEGEILFALPWNAMINDHRHHGANASNAPEEGAIECNTVRNLIDEMMLGKKSKFAPYVEYLKSQKPGQLPSAWSKEGKALLFEVLGGTLPPKHPYYWISDDWHKGCGGGSNALEENAAMLVVQRAEDNLMIPLYDMYNHRNGKWHNTMNHRVEEKEFYMTASRDIVAGEQIYNSYNLCTGCEGRKGAYGTAEIFRDYGFIEQYPQRWIFPESNFAFQVEEAGGASSDNYGSSLRVKWGRKGPPSQEAIEFMQKQTMRLERLKKITKDDFDIVSIPVHEVDSILAYIEAIVQGMKLALKEVAPEKSSLCVSSDSCLPSDGYDALQDEIDELPYEGFVTCEPSGVVNINSYADIEKTQSAYQEIGFFSNKKRDDVCFELEGTTQICTNYRPHYHELMVHIPASYINSVRRVVFVGGGDSMLLHEVLKYPTVELVVGLELDQLVVRKSFQYFFTQPHFHDHRVEWWFGDAAKSLLVLPREYFGSFDLVLVDLSETVVSFSVTHKLDMLQSLALLLNDSGIMVKNELYLEKMNTIFTFTAQIYFPDVPFLCDQIMVMGSKGRNFLKEAPVNHGVEMKLLTSEDVLTFSKHFHDYYDNSKILQETNQTNQATETNDESDQEEGRAGVLLVVEVGHITSPIVPLDELKAMFKTELEALGLHTLGSEELSLARTNNRDENIFVLPMEEGYVTARMWPDQKYCALDIHLWSSFNKMEQLRDALVKALGSDASSLSSYRIVTGGMKGTSNWDEDHKTIGPLIEQTRSCDGVNYVKEGDLNGKETNDIIMEEVLGLLQGDGVLAAVMCGPTKVTKEDCKSLDAVSRHKKIDEVIFIPTCPELAAASEFSENIGDIMVHCEKEILVALRAATASKASISAIVVDPSAPVTMLKIASSIWSSQRNLENLLAKHFTFIVPVYRQNESQRQRHNLLDRIRKVVKFDPLHAVEINVDGLDELAGVGILSRGDEIFFSHLRTAVTKIENRTDLTITTRRMTGGLWRYLDKDTYRPRVYSSNDYDSQPAKDQYRSQIFYGRQIVAQYTLEEELKGPVLKTALNEIISSITKNSDTQVRSYTVGDGLVASLVFQKGSIVLIWNGGDRLDINLFLYRKYEAQMKKKITELAEILPRAALSLRDEQPRGINVVTLMEDVL